MKAANPKAPPNGRRMFADAIISALHRAWDDGVALSVQVDDARGDSRAELRHRGAVLWSQAMPGAQLALPLGDAAPAAKATEAAAPQPAEKPVEKAAAPRRVESEGEPAATRCVVLSVEADDSHCDPVTVRAWAVAHGVHRVGPGVLYWHHEGGASEGSLRMVASIEREFAPLVVTALGPGAPLDVRGHDGPSSLLCVGRPVVDEATGLTWHVTEVQDGDGIVVAREGSTPRLTAGARVLPAHAFEHRWLAGDRVHQWTIVRGLASAPSKAKARAASPRVIEGTPPKAKPPKDPAEARRAKAGYAADRGVVFVSRASDYGRVRCRELDPSKGGIGSVSGGSLGPWRLHGPVNPARTKLLAAIRSGLKKVTFFEVPDVDLAGAEAWLRDNGHLKPAKGAASPGAKAPARLAAVPDADGLAMHGETTIVAQAEEGGGWDRAWVERTEAGRRTKAQGWLGAAKLHRAREYNRGGKCVRDSADERGGAP